MPGEGLNVGFCTIYPQTPCHNTTQHNLLREMGDPLRQSINSPITFIFSPTTKKINDIPGTHYTRPTKSLKIPKM